MDFEDDEKLSAVEYIEIHDITEKKRCTYEELPPPFQWL